MTKKQDRQTIPFIELMYCLFEDAVNRGEIPPGEYSVIISKDIPPTDEEDGCLSREEIPDICEPVSECHEHDGIVTITADLYGASPEEIRYTLHHGVLYLAAHAESVIYRAAYPVEEGAAETLTRTFKNGVIEFTYKKEERRSGNVVPDTKNTNTD
ncbi:hypothetical protein [Methanogenium organophilum]|uniref:Uncharacterized protein n=1 Tax=Methanogenium organophilum TaxID=2199 RepID=A0A9X9T7L7_METOG|nr:hypothetical protein [Methanogenium organophilum]WAI01523.1 hypothetical protein OU421_01225 [Methanogenium organophilum]